MREPGDGTREAMVSRVVHLGFEVRVELELGDAGSVTAQLTRDQAELLELSERDVVWLRDERDGAGQRLSRASGSSASRRDLAGHARRPRGRRA